MVLKTKAIICLFLLSAAEHLFSKEMDRSNYAFLVIAKILKESPEAVILNNNADSLDMAFKQQEKLWLPSVQFDFSANSELIQGDYSYIRNKGIISGPQSIVAPSVGIGISQNLPGNGQISLAAGYGLSYLASQRAYLQQPYLQIGLSQPLSYGTFFMTKDPSIEMLKNQRDISNMEKNEAKFELAIRFIETVQKYNLALLEQEYYDIMLKKENAEYNEQSKRHQIGQKSNVELFNSHMKQVQAFQNYQQASQKLKEAETLISCYGVSDIMEQSDTFRDDIHKLLDARYGECSRQTMQEYEILNQIKNEELSLKSEKSKLAPSLYMQLSLSPDENNYYLYSDFSRSLRELANSSEAWSLNGTIGLRFGLDYASQEKALTKMTDKKIQNLNLQLDVLRDEQEKMRNLYQEWTVSISEYCTKMEDALRKEEEFRNDIKLLLDRNIITEAEYWSTELNYYEVRLNYYRIVWNMIQGKMKILTLSSGWMEFIQQFLEVII